MLKFTIFVVLATFAYAMEGEDPQEQEEAPICVSSAGFAVPNWNLARLDNCTMAECQDGELVTTNMCPRQPGEVFLDCEGPRADGNKVTLNCPKILDKAEAKAEYTRQCRRLQRLRQRTKEGDKVNKEISKTCQKLKNKARNYRNQLKSARMQAQNQRKREAEKERAMARRARKEFKKAAKEAKKAAKEADRADRERGE